MDITQSPVYQTLQAQYERNCAEQGGINQAHVDGTLAKAQIVAIADRVHAQYPQYANHWAGSAWNLVQITQRVRTGLGVAFEPGDVTIGKAGFILGEWTLYSIRNQTDTLVSLGVRPL